MNSTTPPLDGSAKLTVQLNEMFYAVLGDETEAEHVQELIQNIHDFILLREKTM